MYACIWCLYLHRFYARMFLKVAGDNSFRRKENQCNKMYYSNFFDMSGAKPRCFIGRSVLILHAWQVCDTRTLYGLCHRHLEILSVYHPPTHQHIHPPTHTHTHTHTHPGKLIPFFESSRDPVRCCLCVLRFTVQDRVCA